MKVTDLPTRWRRKVKLLPPLTREVRSRCWAWQGATLRGGYACAVWNGKTAILHNVVVELAGLPRPAGLKADHLCNRRACINPHHIEYVTQKENVIRGYRRGRVVWNKNLTHCKYGHEFTPENTQHVSGQRRCRICHNTETREYKRRKRATA